MMLEELVTMHRRLRDGEYMKIILPSEWEIHADNTDEVGPVYNVFRILRKDGRVVSINPDHVIMAMTVKKGAYL